MAAPPGLSRGAPSRESRWVHRAIETHLINKAGLTHASARTGAVTLVQRFGSALNLNIHFHMLFMDGAYVTAQSDLYFRRVKPPAATELDALIYRISERVGRYLERVGLLVRDIDTSYLSLEARDDTPMDDLLGHSITYRIAVDPHQGQKTFTPQTLPPRGEAPEEVRLAKASGFSLHGTAWRHFLGD